MHLCSLPALRGCQVEVKRKKYELSPWRRSRRQKERESKAMLRMLNVFYYLVWTVAASSATAAVYATTHRCHEEEPSRRAWWDRSLLCGGLETVPQLAG